MPISARDFQYGTESCNLNCSVDTGPFSPMRGGSANNIYVIPAPDKLTFNAATLLAAACCVPALLLLISNWNKIREINALEAKRLKEKTDIDVGDQQSTESSDADDQGPRMQLSEGDTNDQQTQNNHNEEDTEGFCTCNDHDLENTGNRRTRNVVATPIFGAAILSILVIGEWNFFSHQVSYQTEPIASIGRWKHFYESTHGLLMTFSLPLGQWAPIVGTGLALVGSVYVLLAKDVIFEKREQEKRKQEKKQGERRFQEKTTPSVEHHDGNEPTRPVAPNVPNVTVPNITICPNCGRVVASDTRWNRGQSRGQKVIQILSDWRRRGTRAMIKLVDFVGTAAEDTFENKKFKQAKERWIQYPGEKYKNPALRETADQYRRSRDLSSMNDQPRSRSGSIQSRRDGETASRNQSPDSPSSPWSRSQLTRLETGTTISNGTSHSGQGSSGAPLRRGTTDSLQVPSPIHYARTRDSLPPISPTEPEVLVRGKGNRRPSVVVSDGDDISCPSPQMRHSRADSQPMSLAQPPRSRHFRTRKDTM